MFAMGIMLLLIGYGLIWTGVERFRGDKVSLLGAFGLPGGTVTTVGSGGETGPAAPSGSVVSDVVQWVFQHAASGAKGAATGGPGGAAGRWVLQHLGIHLPRL